MHRIDSVVIGNYNKTVIELAHNDVTCETSMHVNLQSAHAFLYEDELKMRKKYSNGSVAWIADDATVTRSNLILWYSVRDIFLKVRDSSIYKYYMFEQGNIRACSTMQIRKKSFCVKLMVFPYYSFPRHALFTLRIKIFIMSVISGLVIDVATKTRFDVNWEKSLSTSFWSSTLM